MRDVAGEVMRVTYVDPKKGVIRYESFRSFIPESIRPVVPIPELVASARRTDRTLARVLGGLVNR